MDQELNIRFNTHKVNEDQLKRIDRLRRAHHTLALLVNKLAPDGREKSLALTKIEESLFVVGASISRESIRN